MMQISQGTIGSPWHQAYHSSSSTSELSGYDHGFLRRSPDQYSSRGSMESLDQNSSAYHQPCHLSPAKSTNCIDQLAHLHNKRDSAYSSFSTNSSIPEYHHTSFCKERSYSMESMHSHGNVQDGIKHADIRYIKTVYDAQRGVSEEYEVNSSSVKNRVYTRPPGYNRNNGAHVRRMEQSRVVSESDSFERAPPMPPARSDSYAVARHHERPSSWSSLDQNRSLRIHPKALGSHHASAISCNSSQQLKPVFGEGQLHTVMEKSPESSPLIKSKQCYLQAPQPGQPMLPTGIYPVPSPEPHFAHAPQACANNNGKLYPALAKEGAYVQAPLGFVETKSACPQFEKNEKSSKNSHSRSNALYPANHSNKDRDLSKQDGPVNFAQYKLHFSVGPEIPTRSSPREDCESDLSQTNQYTNNQQHKNETRMTMKSPTQVCPEDTGMVDMPHIPLSVESTFHNERNDSKTKQETPAAEISMESYPNTHEEKAWDSQCNVTPSQNIKIDERYPRQTSDQRNKLDSPSFTKLIDDSDNPVIFHSNLLKSEEPSSPTHKKSYDFTRRRLSSSSTQGSNARADGSKSRSSVLEKICKIEQREQESQRSQISSGSIYGQNSGQGTRGSSTRGSVNSIEDIRNKFNSQEQIQAAEHRRLSSSSSPEKMIGAHQFNRTGSVYSIRSGDTQKQMVESQVDKMQQHDHEQYVLQAVPDDDKRKSGSQTKPNKETPWHSTSLDTVGFNKTYRNSIKDAQSKVLEATSYRRKDLEISPPQYKKPEKNVKRPTSAFFKGKTSPVFPHAPKERHSVTPTDKCAKIQDTPNQENQSVPGQLTRIGARKRLTAEQKKRSYSEPEKMNEVGASDSESSPLSVQKRGQNFNFLEQTVADRRRMFERDGKACSTVNLSKPELKQLQQNALADYIERKTGRRPSSQESGFLKERSQSTYFSGSMMDNQSISSTSSMNSLQDHNLPYLRRDQFSNTGRVSSTLPPGLNGIFDLSSFEQNTECHEMRSRSSSFAHQLRSERLLDFRSKSEHFKNVQTDEQREVYSSRTEEFINTNTPADRAAGRSASADDLLDKLEQHPVAMHVRSRSSPAGDKKSQDFMRQNISERSSSQSFTNQGFRGPKSRDVSQVEKTSSQHSYQTHDYSFGVQNQIHTSRNVVTQNAMQVEVQKHTRTQSLTPTTGIFNHSHDSRHVSVPLSSNPSPSKVATSRTTPDFVTAEEYLYGEKNVKASILPVVDKENSSPALITSHVDSAVQDLVDKVRNKSTPPQRPPPPKIKCANLVSEGNVLQSNLAFPQNGQKLSPGVKGYAMWSSSSSEPETPIQHGKISLRISESGLHSTFPVIGQDDEDDEVFVKEQDHQKYTDISVIPSPPPYPPPSIEDAKERVENSQHAPTTMQGMHENKERPSIHVSKDSNDRYSLIVDEMAKSELTQENKKSNLLNNSTIPTRDSELHLNRSFSTMQALHPIGTEPASSPAADLLTQSEATSASTAHASEYAPPALESDSTLTNSDTNVMTAEDVKSQKLAQEIVNKDKSLADILDPESKMKTTMDLMEGLFSKGSNALKENNRNRKNLKTDRTSSVEGVRKEEKKEIAENVVSSSAYYFTSAPKAELLMKIKDMDTEAEGGEEQLNINEKKAELIFSLTHKLEILKEAKESLLSDIKLNNSLGEEVEMLIESLCKPNEFDKYKMFIGDLDKVVNLLLSLSGRLARVENVLSSLGKDANAEERNTWNKKKKQLTGQHEDARELKENLDRREKLVMDILTHYLTVEQFQDYQHFVKMKSALLIEQRELDDKIKLGQEQLKCLLESLPSDFYMEGVVPLKEGRVSSFGNINIPPPLTSSL